MAADRGCDRLVQEDIPDRLLNAALCPVRPALMNALGCERNLSSRSGHAGGWATRREAVFEQWIIHVLRAVAFPSDETAETFTSGVALVHGSILGR